MQIHTLAFFQNLFGPEGLALLLIGLLIFGRRLPEVGKNLGQTIVEFKKGLNGKTTTEPEEQNVQPPVSQNVQPRQNRIVASTPQAKSLPSTEEV